MKPSERISGLDKPIKISELKKYSRVCMVALTEEPGGEDYIDVSSRDELKIIDGIFITAKEGDQVICIEPVIEITDQHKAIARIKLRRCHKCQGYEW